MPVRCLTVPNCIMFQLCLALSAVLLFSYEVVFVYFIINKKPILLHWVLAPSLHPNPDSFIHSFIPTPQTNSTACSSQWIKQYYLLIVLRCFNVIRPIVANSSLFGAGVFCFFLYSFVPPESCRHHHHVSSRFWGCHPCCLQHEISGGTSNFEPCNFKLTCQ